MSAMVSSHANDGGIGEDIVTVRESIGRFIDAEIAPH